MELVNKPDKEEKNNLADSSTSKDIQPIVEGEEQNLDEHGRPIHQDRIRFKLEHKDLIFIHETIRHVMERGLVPPDEVGPIMTLLEDLATMESEVHRYGVLELPVNYFVGMWHCLNTGRMFSIYKQQFKKKDRWLDKITEKVAESIDAYHTVKKHERNEESMEKSPEYFKKLANVKSLKLLKGKPAKKKKKGKKK